MDGLRSPGKKMGISKILIFSVCSIIGLVFFANDSQAQKKEKVAKPFNTLGTFSTSNQFIWANVDGASGRVSVLLPPGTIFAPSLDFPDHSYFTCSINGTFFTNNIIISLPPTATLLDDGNTVKIADTIRTTWLMKNGVDIIQDIYPVAFTKSGQIVYKWKFINHNGSPANVGCQYLQDVEITDPGDPAPIKSNDGPVILTKWAYKPFWLQYPNTSAVPNQLVPSFYIGFLHDLPYSPIFTPNLSGQGYTDYPQAPLNLIKPFRMTIGDWATMTGTIFGPGAWPVNNGTQYGSQTQSDDAILLEFPPQGIPQNKTVEVGRTSYGTGEFERCIGNLFSIVFYPHHLVWTKTGPSGFYTPNPATIEKFVVNGPNDPAATSTKITLTVGDDMTLVDTVCSKPVGKSQTFTVGPGGFLGPGDVVYLEWFACTNPALFCTGADVDTLQFTGTSTLGPPTFINPDNGNDECDQLITIDCAELDVDPPLFSDTVYDCHSAALTVSDSRSTDRGLQSITWVAEAGTDTSIIKVSAPVPPIGPCYTDKQKHTITITKTDSTKKGCIDFTMTDCLGHQSYTTLCLTDCPLIPHPDSLPPVYTLIKKWGTYDSTLSCDNNRIDSFEVSDNNIHDSGICTLDTIPGSVKNMQLNVASFSPSTGVVRFSVSVQDSMFDGNLCIRATDCSKEAHYTDTCFHYCTIHDVLAPRISIVQSAPDTWHVKVHDDTAWDRLIDTIFIVGATPNMSIQGPIYLPLALTQHASNFEFDMKSNDTTQVSSFCIEANDFAGNRSPVGAHCVFKGVGKDSLCPNIVINPPLTTNPKSITVDVNDIHFLDPPTDTIKYVWDTGVDSVWFTNNTGMNTPAPISGSGRMTIPQFVISVIDTNAKDTAACVTINARDLKGNTCSETYCYPYIQDNLPPVITLAYDTQDKSKIFGVVTDSTTYDRGLDSIGLYHNSPGIDTNLKMKPIYLTKTKVQIIDASNAITRDPTRSSTGNLHALDFWGVGSLIPAVIQQHTASVDFAIYVQDFKFKPALLPAQGTAFTIPVYFVKNDSFRVKRKGITDFSITFTMSGDVSSIVFDGPTMIGTEMQTASWNPPQWSADPTGTRITVTGTMGSGTVLASIPLETLPLLSEADSLVILNFHSNKDQSTRQVNITIDSFVLNNGRDTVYTGTKSGASISTARMPAPYGAMTGSTIVITGQCAPTLNDGSVLPSAVSLDPPHPNPFSHMTTFTYTVAQDGPVRFAVYDVLGQEIKTIVNDFQKQGSYSVSFDGSSLGSGNYVARLETGGVVRSRRIGVEK